MVINDKIYELNNIVSFLNLHLYYLFSYHQGEEKNHFFPLYFFSFLNILLYEFFVLLN